MTQLIKDLFKNEKRLGKTLAVLTVFALIFSASAPGAFAYFYRTLLGSGSTTAPSDPETFGYGYGWNGSRFSYGFGYGYGYAGASGSAYLEQGYLDETGDTAYTSPTSVTASTISSYLSASDDSTQITFTDTVSVANSGGTITVALPSGLVITEASGDTVSASDFTAASATFSVSELGSGTSPMGAMSFGSSGKNLRFSKPIKITFPVTAGVGESISIGVIHSGGSLSTASLATSSSATCSAGAATPSASTVTVDSDRNVTIYTCAASKFAAYRAASTGTTTTTTSSSGGGGGGGGYAECSDTSNSVLCTFKTTLADIINKARTFTRSLQLISSMISTDKAAGTKTAKLTGPEGKIVHKPSAGATLSAEIPGNTSVMGSLNWDGKIDPPVLRSSKTINAKGEAIQGMSAMLQRNQADAIIHVGSEKSTLNYSNPITFTVPMEKVADGKTVTILTSEDGNVWQVAGSTTVSGGKAVFQGTHTSFFVLSSTLGEAGMQASGEATFTEVSAGDFMDTKSHWARAYVSRLKGMGVISGKSATRFAPDDSITRAELTKIAVNTFGLSVPASVAARPFMDVDTSAWYAPYVQAAKDAGIVSGVGNGTRFEPNAPITRAAALKIFIEAAKFTDVDAVYAAEYTSKPGWSYVFFPDVKIGEWFGKYVAYAKHNSIVSGYGDGQFKPGNPITRAEASKIAVKVLDMK